MIFRNSGFSSLYIVIKIVLSLNEVKNPTIAIVYMVDFK